MVRWKVATVIWFAEGQLVSEAHTPCLVIRKYGMQQI